MEKPNRWRPTKPGLSLTCRDGEYVVLTLPNGEQITVTNELSLAGRTRFRFNAPRNVKITRSRLLDRTHSPQPAA